MGADKHERTRKEKQARYLRLFHWMMASPAWNSLSPIARAVYIQLAARYMGSNNGRIPFSVREDAADLQVSKSTVHRSLLELVDRGFIVPLKRGAFSLKLKHATEWRLTEHTCDVTHRPASKDFMRWQPLEQNSVPPMGPHSPTHGTDSPTHGTVVAEMSRNGPTRGTVNAANRNARSHPRDTYSLPGSPSPSSASVLSPLTVSPYLVATIERKDARAKHTPQGAVASERAPLRGRR